MTMHSRCALVAAMVCGLLMTGSAGGAEPPRKTKFNRDIRAILSDNCFKCHGPDANQRQADLRLDDSKEATAERDGTPAIVPGMPDKSELVRRIMSDDQDERMPPKESGKSLTKDEIDMLVRWVAEGAEYESHWAWIKPRKTAAPKSGKGVNPIDAFVAARLKADGLKMSPEASRRVLIRRLYFDLTGMPPEFHKVRSFVANKSPQAYERLVDQLLASKQFGERMAMYWLDIVRYADTNGIHGDNHREHWLYRNYVIDAFNDDKPFDVFTREQLSGDLQANPSREQLIASGYNRLNMTTREGGAQAKEYRAKYAADRVRNASAVWLGATMGCSECHDHKFDPFTTRDFYRLAAFFADLEETAVGVQKPSKVLGAEQLATLKALDEKIAPLTAKLEQTSPELEAAQAAWEAKTQSSQLEWKVLKPSNSKSAGGAELKLLEDGAIQAGGPNPDKDEYQLDFAEVNGVTAIRLEVLPDASAPDKGPGRAANGNFVVTQFLPIVKEQPVAVAFASATHSQQGWPDKNSIDGKDSTGWAVLPQIGKPNEIVFELKEDAAGPLSIKIRQHHGGSHTLARFRLSVTEHARPLRAKGKGLPAKVAAVLKVPADKRDEAQKKELAAYYRSISPLLTKVRNEIAGLKKQKESVGNAAPVLLISKSVTPRMTRVLPRGNWLDDSGEIVKPATPSFLPRIENSKDRADRRDLAAWIVSPDNPLTARVFVNRLWNIAFGRGIVRSLDDFGSQGGWPSHPELLDWMAVEFREGGWKTKRMMKLIVMSRTYRQSSFATAQARQSDPFNRQLSRQGRFRLSAEMVRDNALAVSGLLVKKIGGPSVKPYQPSGYWSHLNFPKRVYKHDSGESQYRRGLYTYWCRTFLHPSMLAFDAPSREECTVERPRSNTPLAALVLLNDPTYVEAARAFAERVVLESKDKSTAGRLRTVYAEALHRQPNPREIELLSKLFDQHLRQYQEDKEAAQAVFKNGLRSAPKDLDLAELSAWTSVCRVVFNLHEFISRY